MLNPKRSLQFALSLIGFSLLSCPAVAQADPQSAASTGGAESLRVEAVDIQDFPFEQASPRQIETFGLKRELEVKLVPPPDRQNTVYDNTEGVHVQVRPKPKLNEEDQ